MFSTVFGLPAHPLVVHAVVVLVPLAALGGVVVAVWPAARARYARLALAVATLALISVPLATHTGEQLEPHIRPSPLVERHTEMADGLLPFMALLWLALAVLVGVQWYRGAQRAGRWPSYVAVVAACVTIAAGAAACVQVVRIGHSGSEAAWHGVTTSSTPSGPHH